MEDEYWTPEDFLDGHCTSEDIGKEKPPVFEDDIDPPADLGTPHRPGRPPNTTARARSVQESMQLAFHGLGGADGLMRWGRTHPTEFYRLCGRLIPVEIKAALDVREVTITHALRRTALDLHPEPPGGPRHIHLLSTSDAEAEKPEQPLALSDAESDAGTT